MIIDWLTDFRDLLGGGGSNFEILVCLEFFKDNFLCS